MFAVGIGDRLRERIYADVVPRIARSIAEQLDKPPRERPQLDAVYDVTLTVLYRLLFVLYAEAREFLPIAASAGYRAHPLGGRIDACVAPVEAGRRFDPRPHDIWDDLTRTFGAGAEGHLEWGCGRGLSRE